MKGTDFRSSRMGCLPREVNQLLFASDIALVADSAELNRLVSKARKGKLKINARKSKVMRCRVSDGQKPLKMKWNEE